MEDLLLEAQDSNSTQERLVELSRQYSPAIKKALAQHPNTPLPILLRLAEKQPRAVLENPSLPLLLLENPNLLHGLEERAAVVYGCGLCPPGWLTPLPPTQTVVSDGISPETQRPQKRCYKPWQEIRTNWFGSLWQEIRTPRPPRYESLVRIRT